MKLDDLEYAISCLDDAIEALRDSEAECSAYAADLRNILDEMSDEAWSAHRAQEIREEEAHNRLIKEMVAEYRRERL